MGKKSPSALRISVSKWARIPFGYASFFEDLREIKQLEKEKLEAERLAAVGQTVAGIAHGVKNIIMGLEGGLYVVKSASKKQDSKLAEEGWRMLENNIMKISALIKDFLNFSKGREPRPRWVHPDQIARDVIALYEEAARKEGITLVADLSGRNRERPDGPSRNPFLSGKPGFQRHRRLPDERSARRSNRRLPPGKRRFDRL